MIDPKSSRRARVIEWLRRDCGLELHPNRQGRIQAYLDNGARAEGQSKAEFYSRLAQVGGGDVGPDVRE